MTDSNPIRNRVLAVDDEPAIISEYCRCLAEQFNMSPEMAELEKSLFDATCDDGWSRAFEVEVRSQGNTGVDAVREAMQADDPFAVIFLDIAMPPGIDGIDAAKQIRELDPDVNIVIVSGTASAEPENLVVQIPPADRLFFFKKPFHSVECRQLTNALCSKWHAERELKQSNELLEQRVMKRTAELHKLAYIDPITQLPNRNRILAELKDLISEEKDDGLLIAVALLDIERFSFINETSGYEAGTDLLRAVGEKLTKVLRSVSSESNVVGRVGADEFACLITDVSDEHDLHDRIAKIESVCDEPFEISGRHIHIDVSIGVACHPLHGDTAKIVYRCAEAALHRSRKNVEKRSTFYAREMQLRAQQRHELESEFRTAIDKSKLDVHYQPQLCLRTGDIVGVEALARWTRENGTSVPPDVFVPLSEELGMSDDLFQAVLAKVCATKKSWKGHKLHDIPVSINMSVHQLRNPDLLDIVDTAIDDYGLNTDMIKFELTETSLLDNLSVAHRVLAELAEHGLAIQIDDFGTGYSSLSYLAELPVQSLKIDQSFVARVGESSSHSRVVQAVIALGKALDLQLIAEGIETENQLVILRNNGCDVGQGFLISLPLTANGLLQWTELITETTFENRYPLIAAASPAIV